MRKSAIKNLEDRVGNVAARSKPPPPNPWTKVVEALSQEERMDLARVIKALEESNGTATLETLPPSQRAVWEKATRLREEL